MAEGDTWKSATVVVGVALSGVSLGAWPASAQQRSVPPHMQAQAPAPQAPVQTEGPAATPAVVEEKGPNAGRIALLFGADWASAYYFRGIVNEQNGGNNVQPYGEIGFKLLDNVGPLTSLVLAPGIWNNWHYGGGTVVEPSDPKFWYEADLYIKLAATWWEVLSTGVSYTYYVSPNDSFTSYADVGLSFSLGDAKWLGPYALNPSLLFAFETKGEALAADGKKGVYMGLGLAPGYTFFADSSFPVNISLPMTFGFSLKDYYTVNGENQTFGYFSGGPLITLPLKFIPATFSNWALKGGVQFLKLNGNLATVNGNDSFVPIGSVGLSLTY
jgi:hypothetical protein